jgi:hypothetical protein
VDGGHPREGGRARENPPRPLSLKTQGPSAVVGSARFSAQEALNAARTHGYSQVVVEIDLPGKSVAEVRAKWDVKGDGPNAQDLAPVYDGDIVATVNVVCADGVYVIPKPRSPSRTGVAPSVHSPSNDDQKDKR